MLFLLASWGLLSPGFTPHREGVSGSMGLRVRLEGNEISVVVPASP